VLIVSVVPIPPCRVVLCRFWVSGTEEHLHIAVPDPPRIISKPTLRFWPPTPEDSADSKFRILKSVDILDSTFNSPFNSSCPSVKPLSLFGKCRIALGGKYPYLSLAGHQRHQHKPRKSLQPTPSRQSLIASVFDDHARNVPRPQFLQTETLNPAES
jgi:hypothetical protein